MAQPVFILGLQRSGTTWMANQLEALPQVSAVAAAEHNGVHESIFFSHFARAFGPWEDAHARRRFGEAFRHSDYWVLTELPDTTLTRCLAQSATYADFFCAVMDRLAQGQGAQAWVEKSPHHTLMYLDLALAIPQARFICVVRETEGMVLSRFSGFGRTPPTGLRRAADLVRATTVNTLFTRYLKEVSQQPNCMLVQYEAMRNNTLETNQAILEFLGIPALAADMKSRFEPNSSFSGAEKPCLSSLDRAVIAITTAVMKMVPLSALLRLHHWRGSKKGIVWPDWCWKRTGWHPDLLSIETPDKPDS